MKLVWMMIVMATGAMLMIAATLLVKPFDLKGQSFYRSDKGDESAVSWVFCSDSKSEDQLLHARIY